MRNNFYETIYTLQLNVEDALAAGNYPASGSYIDVSMYSHFAFLVLVGALDTETTIQVKQDTSATETGSIKNIADAVEVIAADDDDQTFLIEVEAARLDIGNDFRYVTLAVSGATGSNDFAAIAFLGWNAAQRPVTQPSVFPSGNHSAVVG